MRKAGQWTRDALVLVKLAEGYPATKPISKTDLTAFINLYYPGANDVQQARHLAAQKGFNILSGTRGNKEIAANHYQLEELYPAFIGDRRAGYAGDFAALKKHYDYCCATCGSKEGQPHRYRRGVTVQLQQGHMDNSKPLAPGNIIPQCQICNRADRDRWIYDKTGRVTGIAATADGLRMVMDFLKRITKEMRAKILAFLGSK
ncbi:hypothetical protein [Candidatus Tokpelaia sp.]|uniref:hypothetical protein n=1 Tax=Candidatus Tokpelaia sp. TaxID=2233777 RepID=UPI00123BAA4E|nr:hypothetical protein [Candidatus Tokpelaia sp.]KAA6405319.1 hypothetical protein DPQ22_05595 [Candidatus Tokpelaia sp.]